MAPVPLASSAIASIQFNEDDNTITIVFTSGKTETKPCTREVYEEFLAAESPGKFWHQRFRKS